jgi:hypothetical protein
MFMKKFLGDENVRVASFIFLQMSNKYGKILLKNQFHLQILSAKSHSK